FVVAENAGTQLVAHSPDPFTRSRHGGAEEVGRSKEVRTPKVRESGQQAREERDASAEERHAQARQERPRRQGEEPQAGDRDRALGSAEERGKGSAQE